MILKEEKRDLFTVDEKYFLVHCISADYELGAGIAVEFQKRYNLRNKLFEMNNNKYPSCIFVNPVFNLVTKNKYWNKPTYDDLYRSLEIMVHLIETEMPEVKYLAMPKIGCGLDRLQWSKVREIIKNVFQDLDIEILVCYL